MTKKTHDHSEAFETHASTSEASAPTAALPNKKDAVDRVYATKLDRLINSHHDSAAGHGDLQAEIDKLDKWHGRVCAVIDNKQ